MTNKIEKQLNISEILPETRVKVVAFLDDIRGKHYFLKTEAGKYFYLDQDLEKFNEVNEDAVMSAITKHGYKPLSSGQFFEFRQRIEVLEH